MQRNVFNSQRGQIMKTVEEIETQIRVQAVEDEAFRARLLDNPKAAIEEVTGLVVPESFSVHVHEEGATEFHVVVPPAGGRLSDEELRSVAAGVDFMQTW